LIRRACAVCRRIITDVRAEVLPDNRGVVVIFSCHGAEYRSVQLLDIQGVAFNDGSVLDLETRDPDEFIARKGSGGSSAGR
jgi:hypothetical protein